MNNNTEIELIEPSVCVYTSVSELMHQLHVCEAAGRVCYDSTDKLTDEVDKKFIARLIDKHHESVLEHAHITFEIITDRATTHQLVRHRLCSYSQQSQRYCRYAKPGTDGARHVMRFIAPAGIVNNEEAKDTLVKSLQEATNAYESLLSLGCKPEEARAVLPNCTATKIVVTANVRQLRHIFNERLAPAAQADIKLIMYALWEQLINNGFGFVFDNVNLDTSIFSRTAKHKIPDCVMAQEPVDLSEYNY